MDDIRVFIADLDQQERSDLAATVAAVSGAEVVGSAGADEDALVQILSKDPDVVVVRIPDTEEALDLCRRMLDARPRIRCLVLATPGGEGEAFAQAVLVGAAGIVRREHVANALDGGTLDLHEEAVRLLSRHGSRAPEDVLADLTPQQRDVALLVVSGATNSEIARRLHLSPHTVRNYLSHIMARLGMRNRTELAVGLATALVRLRGGSDTRG